GIAPAGPTGRALTDLVRFDTGPVDPSVVGFAFVAIAGLALVLGRDWRLAWAGRAWFVALGFFAIVWAGDRHWISVGLPEAEVLLAPAACGLALAAAAGGAAFELDVRGSRFSWRQLASIAAAVLVVIGAVPAVAAATNGRWSAPESGLPRSLGFLNERAAGGAYRVLWLGDPRVMPVRGWALADGLEFGLSQGAVPGLDDQWPGKAERGVIKIKDALTLAGRDQTARLGRLLAPMAVRYVIVPNRIAPSFENVTRYPAPDAVLQMLAGQLDLRRVDVDEAVDVYENQAWLPGRAVLTGESSGAAGQTGFAPLVTTDLSGNGAALEPTSTPQRFIGTAGPGELFLSQSSSDQWELTLDGKEIARRPAFGWANVFTLDHGGQVELAYKTPVTRWVGVIVQLLLWLVALRLAWRAATRGAPSAEFDEMHDDFDGSDEANAAADPEPLTVAATPTATATATMTPGTSSEEFLREPRPIRRPTAIPAEQLGAHDLPWLRSDDDEPVGGTEVDAVDEEHQ
ncbi:MAG: hypothetical protein IT196_22590, partial [Acidimicrobiales bacterium]|nr:hypothetical protein [Acidimicrobiales bacterium]